MLGDLLAVLFGNLLALLFGVLLAVGIVMMRRRRRLARDNEAGRPLMFPGSVIGPASYCHPVGGLLRLDGATLHWLTDHGGLSYPVPTDRLDVRGIAHDVPMSRTWLGHTVAVVCADATQTIRIEVLETNLPYLARALPGLAPLLKQPRP